MESGAWRGIPQKRNFRPPRGGRRSTADRGRRTTLRRDRSGLKPQTRAKKPPFFGGLFPKQLPMGKSCTKQDFNGESCTKQDFNGESCTKQDFNGESCTKRVSMGKPALNSGSMGDLRLNFWGEKFLWENPALNNFNGKSCTKLDFVPHAAKIAKNHYFFKIVTAWRATPLQMAHFEGPNWDLAVSQPGKAIFNGELSAENPLFGLFLEKPRAKWLFWAIFGVFGPKSGFPRPFHGSFCTKLHFRAWKRPPEIAVHWRFRTKLNNGPLFSGGF